MPSPYFMGTPYSVMRRHGVNRRREFLSRLPPGDSVSTMVRATEKMRATVLHSPHHIAIEEVSRPRAGVGEAVIRITLTTICGTDLHILRGEYPVKPGLIIGHEPVGVI